MSNYIKIIAILIFIFNDFYCFGQSGYEHQYKYPMNCEIYTIFKDSAFVDKQVYKLDKISVVGRTYIRGDSTLVVEAHCSIALFSNIAFKKYEQLSDSAMKANQLPPPGLLVNMNASNFLDYVDEYLTKTDSLRTINVSEFINCLTISHWIDEYIFLGKKQITPSMYEYKNKFDSAFNIRFSIYSPLYFRTDKVDRAMATYAIKCEKDGYEPHHNDKQSKVLNICEDIKDFYKTCPIKYKLLTENVDRKALYIKRGIRLCPIYFFVN